MFYASARKMAFISGAVWLAVGIFLVTIGLFHLLNFLQGPLFSTPHFSPVILLSFWTGHDVRQAATVLITLSLLIGYVKGKFVLVRSVRRQVTRLRALPPPVSLRLLYGKGYYLLIASMIGLGFLLRVLPISEDLHGAIDMTIGCALIHGAVLFFRAVTDWTRCP